MAQPPGCYSTYAEQGIAPKAQPQAQTNEDDPPIQIEMTVRRKLTAVELERLVKSGGDLRVITGAILNMKLGRMVKG